MPPASREPAPSRPDRTTVSTTDRRLRKTDHGRLGHGQRRSTMKALRAHTRGGPEVLVYEDAPPPTPADGELLVAVHAAAITFDELTWPDTWASEGVDRTPVIPSHEFSG